MCPCWGYGTFGKWCFYLHRSIGYIGKFTFCIKGWAKKSIESALLNEEEFDYFEGIDALIFYHFKKNPDLMDDEEYIQHYKAIDFQQKIQNINLYSTMKKVMVEVANGMFSEEN